VSATVLPIESVRFVKELYPRLKPHDDVIERYRDALAQLPPIVVARDGVLVDGYHRWQAHVREGAAEIAAENLGDIADAEILRESYRRNAAHGEQMTKAEKTAAAERLYLGLAGAPDERYREIAYDLSLSVESAEKYCAKARQNERKQQQDQAWAMWLDCVAQTDIAATIGQSQQTISNWVQKRELSSEFCRPPGSKHGTDSGDDGYWGSIQHFDVWQFQSADKDSGQQSYFGALPPQVVENLLWLYTEPGQTVTDPFAGSGTTIDVAKAMGRRVWASDRIGNRYSPHLPIHEHDAREGWPDDAPGKADLVILDPPYWQQAKGRYSDDAADLGNQSLEEFYAAWAIVAKAVMEHVARAAYIISPTQLEDGQVVDHATDMLAPFTENGWHVERRIIVTYQTQQASGQQVEWARENKRLLKLYRDLVVMSR
jgi:hypothetical protein